MDPMDPFGWCGKLFSYLVLCGRHSFSRVPGGTDRVPDFMQPCSSLDLILLGFMTSGF